MLSNERGITLIEILIAAVIALGVGAGALEFYQAQHRLFLAQTEVVERQGNLRFAMDDLSRMVRRTGYRLVGGEILRVSASFDTLEVYLGNDSSLTCDTVRYYINRFDDPPSLIKQINQSTPAVFAEGIDSARFVPAGGPPPQRLAVSLVAVEHEQYENTALATRRRIGETINLRNQ